MLKKLNKLFLLGLLGGLVACGESPTPAAVNIPLAPTITQSATRGVETIRMTGVANVQRFQPLNEKFDLTKLQTVVVAYEDRSAEASEDAKTVVSIFNTLLAAGNETNTLSLKFSMSDEPIEDGVFVFAIESDKKQDLKFEMFDEEGFELAAQNTLNLQKGSNYKALNVRELDNGAYLMRLQDKTGATLIQKVTIQN